VRAAFQYDITAEQIITFLEAHAHPYMQRNIPVLPLTVVDQIRLWEIEKNRFSATPGLLYKEFAKQEDVDRAVVFAESIGVLLWRPRVSVAQVAPEETRDAKKVIVVTESGHAEVKAFVGS